MGHSFLPRSKHLLTLWLQSPSPVILELKKKKKSVTVSIISPSICLELMGPDAMILVFWMLSFKPFFSLSFFTFIKRFFSSLLSAIRVVSSAHLRLLIFLLAILIPPCASSGPVFHMMYTAYKYISRVTIYSLDVGRSQFTFLLKNLPVSSHLTHSVIHGLYFEKKIFHVTWTTVILISYHFFFLFYQDMLLTQGLHICWLLSW